ncbi:hypothetical protein [Bacillus dakarensis]|uniref:hypothetical protein n=1 Tax=Robertmurraya dakarensis TaxID=1926278 RepID=UPI0009808F00|nr:hypothetical protein [Bacillus dakarensis]
MYDEKTQKTLDMIKEYYGGVPDTYYAMADAGVVSRVWYLSAPTFFTGQASDEDKRICAAVVGHTIGSDRLVEAHYMILKRMGWSRDDLKELLNEQYPARMNDQQILYAKLAKSLAINPLQVDRDIINDIEDIASKNQLAEIVSLVAFVRYTSTFIGVYGQSENEEWVKHLKIQD